MKMGEVCTVEELFAYRARFELAGADWFRSIKLDQIEAAHDTVRVMKLVLPALKFYMSTTGKAWTLSQCPKAALEEMRCL